MSADNYLLVCLGPDRRWYVDMRFASCEELPWEHEHAARECLVAASPGYATKREALDAAHRECEREIIEYGVQVDERSFAVDPSAYDEVHADVDDDADWRAAHARTSQRQYEAEHAQLVAAARLLDGERCEVSVAANSLRFALADGRVIEISADVEYDAYEPTESARLSVRLAPQAGDLD